ncbi:far upstream element-binding protein [Gracilaria domingensis]|nr:far upstream element-binding protein [Gracilaria domingensis]
MPASHIRHSLDDPPSRARQIASSFRRRCVTSNPTSALPSKRPPPDYPHPDSPARAVIRRTESSSSMSESPDSEVNCQPPSSPSHTVARSNLPPPDPSEDSADQPHEAESKQPQAHDFVVVPAEHVGLIIGKHGDTIKAIQNTSNAIVSMDRSYPSRDRKFRISGTEDAVSRCRMLIQRRLEVVRTRSDSPLETREMWIPITKIGLVIGAGGVTIRSIKEKTGAYATVHNDQVEGDRKLLTIHGTAQQASHARQLIVEILQNAPPSPPRDPSLGDADDSTAMYIPRAAVGSVIGSRGTTLRLLHQKSGAMIRVASDEEAGESPERQIIISGSVAAVDRARSMIHFVIREGSLRNFEGARPDALHTRRDDVHPSDSVSRIRDIRRRAFSQGRKEDSFILSAEHIGLLIGKNGANIREMQNRSGAIIEVTGKNESERDSSHRTVSIFGSSTEVKIAKLLIEEKIGISHDEQCPDEEEPSSVLLPQDQNARANGNAEPQDGKSTKSSSSDEPQAEKEEYDKENVPSKDALNESSTREKSQRVLKTIKASSNKKRETDAKSKDGGGQSEASLTNTAVESTGVGLTKNHTEVKQRRISQNSQSRNNSASKSTDFNKRHSKDSSEHHRAVMMPSQLPSSVHLPQPHHSYAPPFMSHGQYHPQFAPQPPFYGEPNLGAYSYYAPPPPHTTYHQHTVPVVSTPMSTNGMGGARSHGSPHGCASVPNQQDEATSAITAENSKSEGDKPGLSNSGCTKLGNNAQTHVPTQFYPTFYQQQPAGPVMYPAAPPMYGGYVYNQHPNQFNPAPNDFSPSKGFGAPQAEAFVHPFAMAMSPGIPVPQHGTSMSPVAGNSG